VADAVTITTTTIDTQTEGTDPIALGLSFSSPEDGDTLSISIKGLPTGASLQDHDGNPLDASNLTAAEAADAYLVLDPEYEGPVSLTVTATTSEDVGSDTAIATANIDFNVAEAAPDLSFDATTQSGDEGSMFSIPITASA